MKEMAVLMILVALLLEKLSTLPETTSKADFGVPCAAKFIYDSSINTGELMDLKSAGGDTPGFLLDCSTNVYWTILGID